MIERRRHKRSILGREERWFLFRVVLLVVLVYILRREIIYYGGHLLVALPMFLAMAIVVKALVSDESVGDLIRKHVTIIPLMQAEGEEKPFIPKATIILILLNILVHYVLKLLSPEDWARIVLQFSFLPTNAT